jgi:hypothetical protein
MVDRLLFDMLNMLHQCLWHAVDGDPVGGCVQEVMSLYSCKTMQDSMAMIGMLLNNGIHMDDCILYCVFKIATRVDKNICDMQMTEILLVCSDTMCNLSLEVLWLLTVLP